MTGMEALDSRKHIKGRVYQDNPGSKTPDRLRVPMSDLADGHVSRNLSLHPKAIPIIVPRYHNLDQASVYLSGKGMVGVDAASDEVHCSPTSGYTRNHAC